MTSESDRPDQAEETGTDCDSFALALDVAERPPLPAGHPLSWGLITQGTVLDGAEYPFPVFLY
jgi:hypothetical protein